LGLAWGGAPGFINVAPLGLAWGGAPGFINVAPLGLAWGVALGVILVSQKVQFVPILSLFAFNTNNQIFGHSHINFA
jgi:hypothetical protein